MLFWLSASAQTPGPTFVQEVPPPSNNYDLGPDSLPHTGVPAGKSFSFEMTSPKTFPGTVRTITVYVPAAYHADKPACVYVGLDGLGFHVPVVLDNLIAQHAMPVTIAIGVSPGRVDSVQAPQNPRFDRSFEFDSLTDRLARFLVEEVLPAVEKHTTPGGERIVLSSSPNDRAIGGGSTGGIGAFTVAWERPDQFRRVFTAIGTFVGMRGGEQYNVLVRKTEPKPLRVFMEDGVHDEWPGGPEMGDWWMSNQTMERALEFAGYEVRHVWGAGTHNGQHADSIFPDALRWLWRDWPNAIPAGVPGNPALKAVLESNESWQVAAESCSPAATIASNSKGEIFMADGRTGKIAPIAPAGKVCPQITQGAALAFGSNGQFNIGDKQKITAHVAGMTVRDNGDVYVTTETGEVWLAHANGQKTQLDKGLTSPSGIALSPDGLWLFVAQSGSRWGLSYRVRPDGTLDSKEPFYDFCVPGTDDDSGARGVWMDRSGYAYVATRMGVQIFDRNGRVVGILPMPGNEPATSVCFGGENFGTLYVLSGGKIYQRKLRSVGAPPWAPAFKLPPWGAG
jgi:gluconolactonase